MALQNWRCGSVYKSLALPDSNCCCNQTLHQRFWGRVGSRKCRSCPCEQAAASCGVEVLDYTAAPVYMNQKAQGRHEWMIEFNTPPKDLKEFETLLDEHLKALNSDYEAKRYKDMTMLSPRINVAQSDLFYRWLATENKLSSTRYPVCRTTVN